LEGGADVLKRFPAKKLRIFSVKVPLPIIYQEVPKLFSQQDLRGLVDKTTAQ
jgi:hypothetical protein